MLLSFFSLERLSSEQLKKKNPLGCFIIITVYAVSAAVCVWVSLMVFMCTYAVCVCVCASPSACEFTPCRSVSVIQRSGQGLTIWPAFHSLLLERQTRASIKARAEVEWLTTERERKAIPGDSPQSIGMALPVCRTHTCARASLSCHTVRLHVPIERQRERKIAAVPMSMGWNLRRRLCWIF